MSKRKSDRAANPSDPPARLPAAPASFWHSPVDLASISAYPENDTVSVLKLLGPIPFPRGRFPVMGFLATLYEDVSKCAADALNGEAPPPHA